MSGLELLVAVGIFFRFLFAYMGERFEAVSHRPPEQGLDYRPPLIRARDLPPPSGKAVYDARALEILRQVEEHGRKPHVDNGQRRRKSDGR
jgi:hypothetical protein